MGLSISWVAVLSVSREQVLEVLHMRSTGSPAPDYPRGVGLAENQDWLVLLSDDLDFASPELMAKLSSGGVAVGGREDDRVMFKGIDRDGQVALQPLGIADLERRFPCGNPGGTASLTGPSAVFEHRHERYRQEHRDEDRLDDPGPFLHCL